LDELRKDEDEENEHGDAEQRVHQGREADVRPELFLTLLVHTPNGRKSLFKVFYIVGIWMTVYSLKTNSFVTRMINKTISKTSETSLTGVTSVMRGIR
jgi:hypothetical protein